MDARCWRRISDAVEHYKACGFREVEVPWHVPYRFHAITCADDRRAFALKDYGMLVGSAEQALIEMQAEGRLGAERYVAVSPCFRDEGADRDDLHRLYFLKVELFSTIRDSGETEVLMQAARDFMVRHTNRAIECVRTPEGFDLEIGGIEVGSYGPRRHGDLVWTCATGLAEPRFSDAIRRVSE